MDLGVKGKAYAIVGGVAGMGLETARLLAGEGASVALIGRNRERGEPRAHQMSEETGADVRMFAGDGTVKGSLDTAINAAAEAFGGLDGLCVTAGTMQTRKTLLDLDDDTWEEYFQAHVMVTVRACRAALPHLIARGGGTIVNTAAYSIRAMKPPLLGYATMKSAIAAITKNIALTYGAQKVRANTVCPGFIASESAHTVMKMAADKYGLPPLEAISKAMVDDWKMNVALGRVGYVEEIAELFAFLLSPRAGYTTGAEINCDGGTQF
ncbi:SDR family NAD(P)-dependent oxidoreductase [Novosphingobium bradum]|uniref:SDR family NAD(P)-dependent oxidoreductase n=1 Tax=Novosphingobium bradum TaxID=1737444 RepID=A0ABV7IM58_9SPHN